MNEDDKYANDGVLRESLYSEITELNTRKDRDYDRAFDKSLDEFGLVSAAIRLQDKLNRIKSFAKTGSLLVTDESAEDSLIDLANYALKTIIAIRRKKE